MKSVDTIKSPYATLREACAYLRVSYSHGTKVWPEWKEKYGVRISRMGRGLVMPYKDLDRMVEMREIN